MKASLLLSSTLCFAATVLATPVLKARASTAAAAASPSVTLPSLNSTKGGVKASGPQAFTLNSATSADQYYNNWAGVSHQGPPSGSNEPWYYLEAIIGLPSSISAPPSEKGDGQWSALAFIGIGGDGPGEESSGEPEGESFLFAGVEISYVHEFGNSDSAIQVFFETSEGATYVYDIDVHFGDRLQIIITIESPEYAEIYFNDLTNGQSVTKKVSAPHGYVFDQSSAEAVVAEITEVNGDYLEIVDFAEVVFTNFGAWTKDNKYGLEGATTIGLVDNGKAITSEKESGSSQLTVSYVG